MSVEPFSAQDRDWIVARDPQVRGAGGQPMAIQKVSIALVPAGRRPTLTTTWHDTVMTVDGPGLLLAGEQSDDTEGAVILTQSVDAYARYEVAGGIILIDELGRVPYRP